MSLGLIVLALVTLQRLGELALARRNTARLIARGAVEVGADHYPVMVGLHAAWLAGLWAFGWNRSVDHGWLAVYILLQVFRVWTVASLGERWTTRIIVLPGEPLIASGPYRYLAHPNYAVVAAEIAILPLALHLPITALIFTLLNAIALFIRIRAEARVLREAGTWPATS